MTPQQQDVHLKLSGLLPSRIHFSEPPVKRTGRVSHQVYLARKKRAKELHRNGFRAAKIAKMMGGLSRQTIYNLIRR